MCLLCCRDAAAPAGLSKNDKPERLPAWGASISTRTGGVTESPALSAPPHSHGCSIVNPSRGPPDRRSGPPAPVAKPASKRNTTAQFSAEAERRFAEAQAKVQAKESRAKQDQNELQQGSKKTDHDKLSSKNSMVVDFAFSR